MGGGGGSESGRSQRVVICTSLTVQVNLDMTDSMGPGKLVRHMQNPSYTYDEYLICIGLGPSILSVICKNPSYSGPSYPSSLVSCYVTAYCCCPIYIQLHCQFVIFWDVLISFPDSIFDDDLRFDSGIPLEHIPLPSLESLGLDLDIVDLDTYGDL